MIVAAMAMCDFTPVPYLVLAGICVLQAVFPTLAGWGVSVGFYAIGAVVYLYALATGGAHGNAVPILLIMVFCAGVTAVLVWARPRRIGDA